MKKLTNSGDLQEAASEFPTLAAPQRKFGNLNLAFEKAHTNHLPVIKKIIPKPASTIFEFFTIISSF
jgi:hypothetical protein